MRSSSIIGAISTVLLFNPHSTVGVPVDSLSVRAPSNNELASRAPVTAAFKDTEKQYELKDVESGEVDNALNEVVAQLGPAGVRRWLYYYDTKWPGLRKSLETKPEATLFKSVFWAFWTKGKGRDPTVADVQQFGRSLGGRGDDRVSFMNRLDTIHPVDRLHFLANLFSLLQDGGLEWLFDLLSTQIYDENTLVDFSGKTDFQNSIYQQKLKELDALQKRLYVQKATKALNETNLNKFFKDVVAHYLFRFQDRREYLNNIFYGKKSGEMSAILNR